MKRNNVHFNPNFNRLEPPHIHINREFLQNGALTVKKSSSIHVNPKMLNLTNSNAVGQGCSGIIMPQPQTCFSGISDLGNMSMVKVNLNTNNSDFSTRCEQAPKQSELYRPCTTQSEQVPKQSEELHRPCTDRVKQRQVPRTNKSSTASKYHFVKEELGPLYQSSVQCTLKNTHKNNNLKVNVKKCDKVRKNLYKLDKREYVYSSPKSKHKIDNACCTVAWSNLNRRYICNNKNKKPDRGNSEDASIRPEGIVDKELKKKSNVQLPTSRGYEQKKFVFVRGESSVLDDNSRTLYRHLAPRRYKDLRRRYVGRANSSTTLIRHSSQYARQLAIQAKQRSIAVLSHSLQLIETPCPVFHRLGRCAKYTVKSCPYLHDTKNVALCQRYLKGICTENNCPLSHKAVPCHFLGTTFRPHVQDGLCSDFVQGFCKLGKSCKKKHYNIFRKVNKKNTQMRDCKPSDVSSRRRIARNPMGDVLHEVTSRSKNGSSKTSHHKEKKARYYADCSEAVSSSPGMASCPVKTKLDLLPAFIPLSMNE